MIRRVAYLSMHTSPLLQPGVGDAGGMNVFVDQLARSMAARGVTVDVFTRRHHPELPDRVTVVPGYTVHHVTAGPARPLTTARMVQHVRRFAEGVLTALAPLPPVDVVHSHYWLSGWAGLIVKRRLDVPMANSFHTLGRIKNLTRRGDEPPESLLRIAAEHEVIADSDCVIASTPVEADHLLSHYGAVPEALCVSPPGVDHSRFYPGPRDEARERLGLDDGPLVAFVGRVQAAKGVDVALNAFEIVAADFPDATLLIVGGPSGPHGEREMRSLRARAARHPARVVFMEPAPHRILADVYRAADVVHVPSRSESFGLVAVEAQACGTPVVATRVGGLPFCVDDGQSGILVDGWEADDHADAIAEILTDDAGASLMGKTAAEWAERFSWENTANRFLELYSGIVAAHA
ncbi:MAG TPA: glycosyltransferase [Acidimicrobiia bacterium]|nr:glycosyltransferase [Acidimicrobiia bacterium]